MPHYHLKAALAKLRRDAPDRVGEIEAMAARLAELDAMPDDAARIAATSPPLQTEGMTIVAVGPAQIGDNQPPSLDELTTFEAIDEHIRDLRIEAANWLDGSKIESQAQADEVSRLLRLTEAAEKKADELRKKENESFDAGKRAVQAKYAPLIADTKSEIGLTTKIRGACRAALGPWLRRLESERQALADAQEQDARERLDAARDAKAKVDQSNLGAVERVEEMFTDAKAAEKDAAAAVKDRAAAGGGAHRRVILRDNWVVKITDATALLRHLWTTRRADLEAEALRLAQVDVKNGARTIPGCEVVNEPVAT